MKKLISYSFVILTALSIMVACRKGDNPKIKGLTIRVPEPQLTKDGTTDQIIAAQNPDAFSAKFTVGLYFASDSKPKSMDVVIIKNGDHSVVKTLQAGVTTYPTVITVTGSELKTLFGASTLLGESYTIGVNITTADGTFVPAFSPLGSAVSYDSGITSQGTTGKANTPYPPATPEITYTAVCKFNMTDYGAIGSTIPYTVTKDEWDDDGLGIPGPATVPVTIVDATHLSFVWGPDTDPHTIVVVVNPTDNSVSVAKQVLGDYGAAVYGDNYGPSSVNSAGNPNNSVAPCDLAINMNLTVTVAAGSFGAYAFNLKKQ